MGYQSFKHIVKDSDGQINALKTQAEALASLDAQVKQLLPEPAAAHCFVTAWSQGQLTIGVDDALYMTDLQYQRTVLRDSLREIQAFAGLTSVTFKVVPGMKVAKDMPQGSAQVLSQLQESMPATPKVLSAQARDALQTAIDTLADDPVNATLKTALSRLTHDQED